MAQVRYTPALRSLEEVIRVLFCLWDDGYERLNPHGERCGLLKKLSDLKILTLTLFQQLWGVEGERSFLGDATRFFSHLFPGVGLAFLFPSAGENAAALPGASAPSLMPELVGDPETPS